MFRCERCGKLSKPGEGSALIQVERRPVEYVWLVPDRQGEPQVVGESKGHETVRETRVCRKCAGQVTESRIPHDLKVVANLGAYTPRTSLRWDEPTEEGPPLQTQNAPDGEWRDEDWVYDEELDTYVCIPSL